MTVDIHALKAEMIALHPAQEDTMTLKKITPPEVNAHLTGA